jgi:hypothetical protein
MIARQGGGGEWWWSEDGRAGNALEFPG